MGALRLFAAGAYDDEADAGDEGDGAEDGGDGEGVVGLVGDLHGAEIDVLLLVAEGDASGGVADDSKDDKDDSDDSCWLHFFLLSG